MWSAVGHSARLFTTLYLLYYIYIADEPVGFVESFSRLDHHIKNDLDNGVDICLIRNILIIHTHNVLSNFGKLDSIVKYRLFLLLSEDYFSVLYESLSTRDINDICFARRKFIRRIWSLHFKTHCELLFFAKVYLYFY
jgi:hypothetical protein